VAEIFSGDPDTAMRWLAVAALLAALGAAGVVILVFRRPAHWRGSPTAHWAMFLGFVVLPGMALVGGNVTGLAYSSSHSCFHCHTMDPWVDDLENPAGETLASLHHQRRWINHDACYTCHSGYGFGGGIRAKLSGMGHVWHQYVAGVPKKIAMSAPFDQGACLGCHGETRRFRDHEGHADAEIHDAIVTGQADCFACHAPPHPRPPR